MFIFRFIAIIVTDFLNYFRSAKNLAALRTSFPECKFYKGVQVSNSNFGAYSILFNNTVVMSSEIGVHCYVQKRSTIHYAKIGNFCSIAAGVTIAPGIHYMAGISTHPAFFLKNTPLLKTFVMEDKIVASKCVTIGHDVWIGQNSIIMDGLTVGTGAVIAAGAVVTKNVPPYAIVGGCPAKIIRYRFETDVIQQLLVSEWWNKDDAWLNAHQHAFMDLSEFSKQTKDDN